MSTWTFRQGGTSVDAKDSVTPTVDVPHILIGRRSGENSGLVSLNRNHDPIASAKCQNPAEQPDSATIGVRKAFGGPSLFLDGYIWRVLVFGRYISDGEVDILADWATEYYGTA